jgi:hypothetical protein
LEEGAGEGADRWAARLRHGRSHRPRPPRSAAAQLSVRAP